MKKSLREQIERIHTLTYGKTLIKEGFLDDLLGREVDEQSSQKIDSPKLADKVGTDTQGKKIEDTKLVEDFYNTIQNAISNGGLSQQNSGSMNYQKEVESMQVALMLLGYDLPKHGVDGLFGPETSSAVQKFTSDNKIDTPTSGGTLNERYYTVKQIHEASKLVAQGGNIIGRPGQGTHNANDWQSRNAWDITGPVGSDVYSLTTGTVEKVKKGTGQLVQSGVKKIFGDQLTITSTDGKPNMFYTHLETNLTPGTSVREGDVIGKIISIEGIPPHVHVGVSTGNLNNLVDDLPAANGSSTSVQNTNATVQNKSTLPAPVNESVRKINLSLLEASLDSPLDNTSVNSPFGTRWGGQGHNGVDLKADASNVKAPADGVVEVGEIKNDACGGTIIISHAGGFKTGFCHMQKINVTAGQQVKQGDVIGISGGGANDVGHGRSDGRHLHFTLRKDGQLVNPIDYIDKSGIVMTGGVPQSSQVSNTKATPEMLTKLLELIKAKNLTPQQLKSFMDKYTVLTGGGAEFTDLDLTKQEDVQKYAQICQKFIDAKQPNPLGITGDMMAKAAAKAFEQYRNFVPAELALAQMAAEGGIGNGDLNSRPIRTKNPYNVGNTDSGANIYENSVEDGIQRYYNLIARSYLGKGKTAKDLIANFVNKDGNRYASGGDYEKAVTSLAGQAHRVAATIVPDNQSVA